MMSEYVAGQGEAVVFKENVAFSWRRWLASRTSENLAFRIRWGALLVLSLMIIGADIGVADKVVAVYGAAVFLAGINCRWSFGVALALLALTAFAGEKIVMPGSTDTVSVYVFYLLCIGVAKTLVELTQPDIQPATAPIQESSVMTREGIHTTQPKIVGKPRKVKRDRVVKHMDIRMRPVMHTYRSSDTSSTLISPETAVDPGLDTAGRQGFQTQPPVNNDVEFVELFRRWFQNNGQYFYRVIIFPLAITGLSGLTLFYGSPYMQPYIDSIYHRSQTNTFSNGLKTVGAANSVQPTATQPAPAATPLKPRSELKVRVENGDGSKGGAQKVAQTMTAKGYVIAAADIANSSNYDHAKTEIYTKDKALAERLAGDLGLAATSYTMLPPQASQATYDVVVITGATQ